MQVRTNRHVGILYVAPALAFVLTFTVYPLAQMLWMSLNNWSLMSPGDILLLHSDGLADHRRDEEDYFPRHAEAAVRRVKSLPAQSIYEAITADLLVFSEPRDDISLVVIKRE
jgi:ABC-type sugar transport system permease subunit